MREHHRFTLNRVSRSPLANKSNFQQMPRQMCPISSKRDLDNQKANISKLNNQINLMLGFVKAKTKEDHNKSTQQYRVNSGLEDYRRRISYLQNIQEIQSIEKEEVIIMRPSASDRKCLRNFRLGTNQEDDYEIRALRTRSPIEIYNNYKRDENDQIPFSKPSQNQLKQYSNRSKSPSVISRPHSKYIARLVKQQSKFQPSHQQDQIELKKGVYEKYQSPKESQDSKKFSYFNSDRISEQASNLTDKSEVIESNKNSSVSKKNQNSEPSVQIERTRTFYEYFKQLDILDDIKNENGQQAGDSRIKSVQASRILNENPTKELQSKGSCKNQSQQEQLNIEHSQKESNELIKQGQERQQQRDLSEYGEVQEQPHSPYERSFELKIYPCDLNRQTVRTYIADRFAKVVQVDVEFLELKKLFLENSFEDKIGSVQKKEKLVKCLWSRGYLINQKDIQSVINFDIPVCPALISSQQRLKLKNFDLFIQVFVDKYLQGEFEWQKKILGMLSQNQILQTGFKPAKIDLEGKGYLKLEDITCFVNLYADDSPCFKNMAVKDLFIRLCRGEKDESILSYQGFMNKICMRNI